jgi:hypothetical protein
MFMSNALEPAVTVVEFNANHQKHVVTMFAWICKRIMTIAVLAQ